MKIYYVMVQEAFRSGETPELKLFKSKNELFAYLPEEAKNELARMHTPDIEDFKGDDWDGCFYDLSVGEEEDIYSVGEEEV